MYLIENHRFYWPFHISGEGEKYITAAQKCIKILLSRINLMETGWYFFCANYFRAAVAFLAASSRSTALWMGKPESFKICLALSTLVPSSLTTRGISRLMEWQALTIPLAIVAQLTIPPKTLTRIALTCLSSLIIRNASRTWPAKKRKYFRNQKIVKWHNQNVNVAISRENFLKPENATMIRNASRTDLHFFFT